MSSISYARIETPKQTNSNKQVSVPETELKEPLITGISKLNWPLGKQSRVKHQFSDISVHAKTSVTIQPKLSINVPGDKYEQEADMVADKVMRMTQPHFENTSTKTPSINRIQNSPASFGKEELKEEREIEEKEDEKDISEKVIQRKCVACEEEDEKNKIKRKESGSDSPLVTSSVNDVLHSIGQSIDSDIRLFMEPRFGFDFSKVRIHDGAQAHRSASDINALAYTHQNNIVFAAGQYRPQTESGKRLLAHELTHVIQQESHSSKFLQRQPAPLTQTQLNQLCYDQSHPQPNPPASAPELHPTYAGWIGSFTGLTTFTSNDTAQGQTAANQFNVIGTSGSRFRDSASTTATEPVAVTGRAMSGEEFIDHPTNEWVVNCLPPNLRATAYQLPADCADIAVILRHVWLSAHHRTETYNGWTVGDSAGAANQGRATQLIREVSSGNVRHMVNPYTDTQGHPITDFNILQNLLHVGDVLVWEHRKVVRGRRRISFTRTGGHTQTINQITRNGSSITNINVLQGNQPIFSDAATAILSSRGVRRPDPESREGHSLRDLPGRRIEADTAIGITNTSRNITDPVTGASIWGEDDGPGEFTVLVVAGPPRATRRPSASRRAGRQILDWRSSMTSANASNVMGVLEAMLQEIRSMIEQGSPVSKSDIDILSQLYGSRFNAVFNRNANDLMQRVQEVVTVIHGLAGDSTRSAITGAMFASFTKTFVENALPKSTQEERRLFIEHLSLSNITAPFASEIAAFSTALTTSRNIAAARTISEQHGTQLWQAATARTHAGTTRSNDDRQLYWSRLRMVETIRQSRMTFRISQTDREQLIRIFENSSRGMPSPGSSAFGSSTSNKRILISGFDPFGLNTQIHDSNPSGATVLALDGQTISANNITAQIEGVIFPVRFRDFDQGMIENFFRPYIDGTNPVNMIMTISQGDRHFDIEESAGRRRSDDFADNEGVFSGGTSSNPIEPPGIASGPEFIGTRLPYRNMSRVAGVRLNRAGRTEDTATGHSITGTGGGFLSNEIFYRTRLLQTNTTGAPAIPLGHLHVPGRLPPQAIINRVQQILQAALSTI